MRERGPVGWLRARPFAADALLAALLLSTFLSMLLLSWHRQVGDSYRAPDALRVALLVVGVVPVAFRRRAPLPALTIMVLALLANQGFAYEDHGQPFAVLVGAYSVAAHAQPRAGRRWGVLFGALLSGWIVVGLAVDAPNARASDVIATVVVYGSAWILGDNVRRRREHVAELEERARRLEHERVLEDREARNRERAAIARELHDVVAHSVTVMVVQASGARRAVDRNRPPRPRPCGSSRRRAGSSLAEMRRILGVLRGDESATLVPQPSVSRLAELAASDGELPVEIRTTGDARELRPTIDVSAFRIVQEALTNVRKHGGPHARATVHVDFGDDALTVKVTDDGRGAMTLVGARPAGAGHGIVGMRERVAVCGGTLQSGPRIGGGWAVTATLPYEEDPS